MHKLNGLAVILGVLMSVSAAQAAPGKGATALSIQIGNGTADLVQASYVGAGVVGRITSFPYTELEPRVEITHFFSNDYAFVASATYGWFTETDQASPDAGSGVKDNVTTITSVSFRVGGDRVVNVGDRASFYFGPGLEWWSGKSKYESGNPTETSPNVSRISVSTRVGGTMWLSDGVGLTCNVGRRVGHASADWNGAKASWWPSSTFGSGGLLIAFGKK